MNNNYWNTQENATPATQEEAFYQTGSTRPPKRFGGLIAILLVVVIFLGGIASALGILNIKLFQELSADKKNPSVSFSEGVLDKLPQSTKPTANQPQKPADGDFSIHLDQTPQGMENFPQEGGLSLQEIYEETISSVVSVSCYSTNGSFSGTGVVISENGYVVTNCHVVDGAQSIKILLSSGETLDAEIVGTDAVSDLAVLHVPADNLTPAHFGDSSSLRVGDTVVAIGDPLGVELRGTMTDGIISAINRDISVSGRTMTLIQTNAALNSGNSGGPLLNCYGQVIGINTMKIGDSMDTAGVEGLGFAIPSTTVKEIVDQLLSQGFVSGRPALGMSVETVSTFIQMYYNLPKGVYVTALDPDSSAATQGVSVGDILLSLNGMRISNIESLNAMLYAFNAGDSLKAVFYRGGKQYTIQLVLSQATN